MNYLACRHQFAFMVGRTVLHGRSREEDQTIEAGRVPFYCFQVTLSIKWPLLRLLLSSLISGRHILEWYFLCSLQYFATFGCNRRESSSSDVCSNERYHGYNECALSCFELLMFLMFLVRRCYQQPFIPCHAIRVRQMFLEPLQWRPGRARDRLGSALSWERGMASLREAFPRLACVWQHVDVLEGMNRTRDKTLHRFCGRA
eukprot:5778085-Amphidinium_carterae.1